MDTFLILESSSQNDRHMTIIAQPVIPSRQAPAWVKKIRHGTIFGQGCRLFNKLPPNLRKLESDVANKALHLERYKRKLNIFLKSIPDTPSAINNSLLHHLETSSRIEL